MEAWVHSKPTTGHQHHPAVLLTRIREQRRILQARWRRPSPRWLLCRPRGGLNDSLCQIQKSIIHALRFNRRLIIDTKPSGLRDDFGNYFETVFPFAEIRTRLTDSLTRQLNQESCHPRSFQGKLDRYELVYLREICNFIDSQTEERPCISVDDPSETVLLHDQCGGGQGYQAFVYFKLIYTVAKEIVERLVQLPAHYKAIHIRHADVPFDYHSFLHSVKSRLQGDNVLICTDSHEVLRASQQILCKSTVLQIANIPDTKGEKLHDNPSITNNGTNIGALADLIALANAEQAIFPSSPDIYPSGFTRLAVDLSGRDDLLRQLLGKANWITIAKSKSRIT
jgi:hypothetical protein